MRPAQRRRRQAELAKKGTRERRRRFDAEAVNDLDRRQRGVEQQATRLGHATFDAVLMRWSTENAMEQRNEMARRHVRDGGHPGDVERRIVAPGEHRARTCKPRVLLETSPARPSRAGSRKPSRAMQGRERGGHCAARGRHQSVLGGIRVGEHARERAHGVIDARVLAHHAWRSVGRPRRHECGGCRARSLPARDTQQARVPSRDAREPRRSFGRAYDGRAGRNPQPIVTVVDTDESFDDVHDRACPGVDRLLPGMEQLKRPALAQCPATVVDRPSDVGRCRLSGQAFVHVAMRCGVGKGWDGGRRDQSGCARCEADARGCAHGPARSAAAPVAPCTAARVAQGDVDCTASLTVRSRPRRSGRRCCHHPTSDLRR